MEDILAIGEIRDGLPRDMIITDSPDGQQDYYSTNDLIDVCTQHNLVVMQCTGLKDKNGQLIYEGDIVKAIKNNPYEEYIGVIQYHICYFSLDYKELGKYEDAGMSLTKNTTDFVKLEVIGNMYENPELLEAI